MKILLYIIQFCLILGMQSCKSHKDAGSSNSIKTEQQGMKSSPQEQKAKIYSFTVSFISIGAGSDYKLREKYDRFIEAFESEKNLKLDVVKAPWGREGEWDYCFDFNGIKEEIKTDFIQRSKQLLTGSKLINIGENTNCRGVIRN